MNNSKNMTSSAAKPLLFVPDSIHYAWPFKHIFDITKTKLKEADVILLTGGVDINPAFYGQKRGRWTQSGELRDAREKELYDYAYGAGKKFLGICRGAQFLCAMAGGKLAQHVAGHIGGNHRITTNKGEDYTMSTLHHQMMLPAGTDHDLIAWTEKLSQVYLDGDDKPIPGIDVEPEIVYFKKIKGLGIQGHPEFLDAGKSDEYETLNYLYRLIHETIL